MYKVGAVSRTVIIQLRFMQIEVSSTKYIHMCIVRKEALEEKLGYKYALYRQCCRNIGMSSGYPVCRQLHVVMHDSMHDTTYITDQH